MPSSWASWSAMSPLYTGQLALGGADGGRGACHEPADEAPDTRAGRSRSAVGRRCRDQVVAELRGVELQ